MDLSLLVLRVFLENQVVSNAGQISSTYFDDDDFIANFVDDHWVVKWKWASSDRPSFIGTVGEYQILPSIREKYEFEVKEWIEKGWLKPFDGKVLQDLPLMAIDQPAKNKVRPVLNYRRLNNFISTHSEDSLVCAESLRKWRQMGINAKLLDLRKAYLQIHVDPSLWPYQVIKYKSSVYSLTRLGFGMNIAPKIMCSIVKFVLEKRPDWKGGIEFYIDDLFINEDIVGVNEVVEHLQSWGLECKTPEDLIGSRVLGLKVFEKKIIAYFGNVIMTFLSWLKN